MFVCVCEPRGCPASPHLDCMTGGYAAEFEMTPEELVGRLLADEALMANAMAKEGVEEIERLIKFCKLFKADKHVRPTKLMSQCSEEESGDGEEERRGEKHED